MPFVKGHGTENDFILLPDLDDAWSPTDPQVRALCDRRAGLGADGVIRVARASEPGIGFFMDYRNADGSVAQMCGNGARVFARYLLAAGLEQPGPIRFSTRGGVRTAESTADGQVRVGMGPVAVGRADTVIVTTSDGAGFRGTAVDVGNPHLVCLLEHGAVQILGGLDLGTQPDFDRSRFPTGVNIEFAVPLDGDRLLMRVFERGVGETRSCGTGTVAAAAAFRAANTNAVDQVRVDVPGGSVVVEFAGADAMLTGPAVLLASGTIDRDFWDLHR